MFQQFPNIIDGCNGMNLESDVWAILLGHFHDIQITPLQYAIPFVLPGK
jgi:hypothetical protein